MTVWVVRYGNYEPAEVLALYDNEAAARAHLEAADRIFADALVQVEAWSVQGEFRSDGPC